MRTRIASIVVGLIACASAAQAQLPVQPVFTVCPTPMRVFSEIQVQTPARLVSDSSGLSKAAAKSGQSANVVEFVVDTLGVPDLRTLSLKRGTDSLVIKQAAQAIARLRYTPAVASGCKVPQRVTASGIW